MQEELAVNISAGGQAHIGMQEITAGLKELS